MAKENFSALFVTPYLNDAPSGANNVMRDWEKILQRNNWKTHSIGSSTPIWKRTTRPTEQTLGTAIRLRHHGTVNDIAIPFNYPKTRRDGHNLVLKGQYDLIVYEEPYVGLVSATLHDVIPKGPDGKRLSATAGHFHAQLEDFDWIIKALIALGKRAKGPITNKYLLPKGFTKEALLPAFIGTLNRCAAVSNDTAAHAFGIFPRDYDVIPNPINTQEFTPEGEKIPEWLDDKKTIFFLGRHEPRKGLEYLLKAYEKIKKVYPDVKFKIAGSGPLTPLLKQQYADLKDIEWLGRIPDEVVKKAYRTADLVVAPSIGGEGFGLVGLEAMSSGAKVVVTNIKGYRFAMKGSPYTDMMVDVDPDNLQNLPDAMAEKIVFGLWKLPREQQLQRQKEGREHAQKFSFEALQKPITDFCESTVLQHGKPRSADWAWAERQDQRFRRPRVIYKAAQKTFRKRMRQ